VVSGEESLKLFGDDLVQHRRFWIATPVAIGIHERVASCKAARNSDLTSAAKHP